MNHMLVWELTKSVQSKRIRCVQNLYAPVLRQSHSHMKLMKHHEGKQKRQIGVLISNARFATKCMGVGLYL